MGSNKNRGPKPKSQAERDAATAKAWSRLVAAVGRSNGGRPSDICVECWCLRQEHLPDHRDFLVICPLPKLPQDEQLRRFAVCWIDSPEAREVDDWPHCRFTGTHGTRCRLPRALWSIYCETHRPASEIVAATPAPPLSSSAKVAAPATELPAPEPE